MTQSTVGLVLDCNEPAVLADFWSQALGYRLVGSIGNYTMLVPADGGPQLLLQRVDEIKAGKNRMHVDIHTPDIDTEANRLAALGARRLNDIVHAENRSRWIVMADPEGNEFCVCDGGTGNC